MDHKVCELWVQVRAPPGTQFGARTAAERFSRAVLERAVARFDAEAPDRLVFMRTLSLRWRLDERQLGDSAVVERCAGDVFARIRDVSPVGIQVSTADTAEDLAVFTDEAHWRAAYLLARALGANAGAWFFNSLEPEGDPLRALAAPARRELAWAVLERLATAGQLVEAIAKPPHEAAADLAAQLLHGAATAPLTATAEALESETPPPPDALIAVARLLPRDLPSPGAALVLHAHARTLTGLSREAIESTVRQCLLQFRKNESSRSPFGTDTANGDRSSTTGAATPNATNTTNTGSADTPSPEGAERESLMKTRSDEAESYSPVANVEIVPTHLGGLFYLLNPALELNLGEVLWRACLPEQKVLAHAVAALVGEALKGDAGIPLFAGSGPDPPVPSVTEDQLDEVSQALLTALCAALPRRGLAQFPQTTLGLERPGNEHLLVARPLSSPFIIFARPAPSPDAARAAIKAFLACWTRSAPAPLAAPEIAMLDAGGRIRATQQIPAPTAALLPGTRSTTTSALLAQTIGVLGCLLQARAGSTDTPTAEAFVTRYARQSANVRVSTKALTVVMPLEAIQVELRRAGLDRDPGWVPWLKKNVEFEYAS